MRWKAIRENEDLVWPWIRASEKKEGWSHEYSTMLALDYTEINLGILLLS